MKVVLQMAMTVNGYIAKENDETPWSDEEWANYSEMVKKIGNIILGHRTYELMKEDNTFEEIGNPFTIVVTEHPENTESSNTIFVKSPEEALEKIKAKHFNEALVGGGSRLNSSFMKKNLVDEIYFDIEPMFFGKGIKLFADENFETKLQLLDVKNISKNLIQLHYKVVKNSK